jgi:hypothetical protein
VGIGAVAVRTEMGMGFGRMIISIAVTAFITDSQDVNTVVSTNTMTTEDILTEVVLSVIVAMTIIISLVKGVTISTLTVQRVGYCVTIAMKKP